MYVLEVFICMYVVEVYNWTFVNAVLFMCLSEVFICMVVCLIDV